jgi:anti-sigma regulatory factor (Ser/Thr protein kinase)
MIDEVFDGAPATVTIPADATRQIDVRGLVRSVAAAAGAGEEATSDLVQAVDELVCNIIVHGYAGRPGAISVAAGRHDDALVVRIRDGAPPFDPRAQPTPRLDLPLAHRPFGGMGVHLARTLTDRIDHRILPTGGNEVTVTKAIGPTENTRG